MVRREGIDSPWCRRRWSRITCALTPGEKLSRRRTMAMSTAAGVLVGVVLVLQRGFEMWCNAARQSCMEGGRYDGPDRDHAQDGLGDPRY